MIASENDDVFLFTTAGKIFRKCVDDFPESNRLSKGKHISDILELSPDEKVSYIFSLKKEKDMDDKYLDIVTKKGVIKRTSFSEYARITRIGLNGITLDEKDEVRDICFTKGDNELIVATRKGYAIRFKETDARELGRNARGVGGISLCPDDEVIGIEIVEERKSLLTIGRTGKGRRSEFSDYAVQNRGGKGVRNYSANEVAGIKTLDENSVVLLITSDGKVIAISANEVNVQFRSATGVGVMRLVSQSSEIVDVTIVNNY